MGGKPSSSSSSSSVDKKKKDKVLKILSKEVDATDEGDTDDDNDAGAEDTDTTTEIARVMDYHKDGAYCEETGEPRITYVHLQCCSPQIMQKKSKGVVHRDSVPIVSDLLSLYDFVEDPSRTCTYNATVCTPLLCLNPDDEDSSMLELLSSSSGGLGSQHKKDRTAAKIGNETILEILDRTLDGLCLQSVTGGWWTYGEYISLSRMCRTLVMPKN